MTDWFTSDLHFFHEKVGVQIRGFESTQAHDQHIITNWRFLIKPQDTVRVLGDIVGNGEDADAALELIRDLPGEKHLITGNHDAPWPGNRSAHRHQKKWLKVFESVQAFARIRLNGEQVLLSHFPYQGDHTPEDRATQYRLRDEGGWLLHGHIHKRVRRTGPRMIHVGLDAWGMMPASADNINKTMRMSWEAPAQEECETAE